MNEYIEKAAILSKCEEMWNNADETTQTGVDTINAIDRITDFIEAMPAADVQPIRRGHWQDNTYRYVGELDAYFIQACCSCCNRYSDRIDQYTKIMSNETCSHCGADMREPKTTKKVNSLNKK